MDASPSSQDEIILKLNQEIEAKNGEVKVLNKKLERSERLLQKTQKYNEDLLEQIKLLSESLETIRKVQRGVDAFTQTCVNDTGDSAGENTWLAQSENQNMTIADCVRAAATEALQQTNFIYDEGSGYYYDSATGYYYDPVNSLYYHSESRTYYYLDPETQTYKFHSQIDPSQFETTSSEVAEETSEAAHKSKSDKSEKQNKKGKKKKNGSDINNTSEGNSPDDAEVIEVDASDDEQTEEGECSSSSDESDSEKNDADDHVNPPCIRCMVEKSDVEKVPEGTLFIVTCSGATVGREKTNDICLPDIQVSKNHAEIKYDELERHYTIVDVGSQNGTTLNGSRLSEPKQASDLFVLNHDDLLEMPAVTLRLHIHIGLETCDQCEPGLVKANIEKPKSTVILSKDDKEKLRRQELKQLKRKFGLQAAAYENNAPDTTTAYNDRAQKRRKVKGSSNPYEKTEAASIDEAIRGNNKGFRMLKKMGWSEGTGLGKSQTGIVEPISLTSNITRANTKT